jgi:hypothetical protein
VIKSCTNDYDVKINASDITNSEITEVFDLKFDELNEWTLAENNLIEVPSMLSMP